MSLCHENSNTAHFSNEFQNERIVYAVTFNVNVYMLRTKSNKITGAADFLQPIHPDPPYVPPSSYIQYIIGTLGLQMGKKQSVTRPL